MNQQGLQGVTHPRALDFAVLDDINTHLVRSGLIDIGVAHPALVSEHWHSGLLRDGLDQVSASARDTEVDLIGAI